MSDGINLDFSDLTKKNSDKKKSITRYFRCFWHKSDKREKRCGGLGWVGKRSNVAIPLMDQDVA